MNEQEAYQEAKELASLPPFESQTIYRVNAEEFDVVPSRAAAYGMPDGVFVDEVISDCRNAIVES